MELHVLTSGGLGEYKPQVFRSFSPCQPDEEVKQKAWLEHYERLLNVEFEWDPEHLSDEPPLEIPPIPISIDIVKKAISKMKSGKAAGPSGIMVEMISAARNAVGSSACKRTPTAGDLDV